MSDEPIKIEEFHKLDPLAKCYELHPDRAYLIVVGKMIDRKKAYALFRSILEMHPDIQISVVETLRPKEVEVREKEKAPKSEDSGASSV